MSYDLFIWKGKQPGDPEEAKALVEWHYNTYGAGSDSPPPVTAEIRTFLDRVFTVWPEWTSDSPDDEIEKSPWATSPMSNDASGPLAQVALVWNSAEEDADTIARIAIKSGLVCVVANGYIYSLADDRLPVDPEIAARATAVLDSIPAADTAATAEDVKQTRRWWSRRS